MHKTVIHCILSIATGEAFTCGHLSISIYTKLYFATINKETYIVVNLKKTYFNFYKCIYMYVKDARSVSLYHYNRSQILQYVKNTK